MPKQKSDPKIAPALALRRLMIQRLGEISLNIELLMQPGEVRPFIAERFRAVARLAHQAAEDLEVDETEESAS